MAAERPKNFEKTCFFNAPSNNIIEVEIYFKLKETKFLASPYSDGRAVDMKEMVI